MISKCDEKRVVLQVDFSENASIASQNEIQSAHWAHGQATLFTGHVRIGEGKSRVFVIVSDDLNHTKQSVYSFMMYIFRYLKDNYGSIEEVNIFSDGAGQQFKQNIYFLICTPGKRNLTLLSNGTSLPPPMARER